MKKVKRIMGDMIIKDGYYEGPRKNQYEGCTEVEIWEDLKKAIEENDKLTEWSRM